MKALAPEAAVRVVDGIIALHLDKHGPPGATAALYPRDLMLIRAGNVELEADWETKLAQALDRMCAESRTRAAPDRS